MLKYVEIDDGYLMYAQCEEMGGDARDVQINNDTNKCGCHAT
jgi:hypothetical protein